MIKHSNQCKAYLRKSHAKLKAASTVKNYFKKKNVQIHGGNYSWRKFVKLLNWERENKWNKIENKKRPKRGYVICGLAAKRCSVRAFLGRNKNPRWWVFARVIVWMLLIAYFSLLTKLTDVIVSFINSLEDRQGLEESIFIERRRRTRNGRLTKGRRNWKLLWKVRLLRSFKEKCTLHKVTLTVSLVII